jgi:hypothetical protein
MAAAGYHERRRRSPPRPDVRIRMTRITPWAAAAALLTFAAAAPAADAVTLKDVKYADLGRAVRDLQGKVVLVEFWGEW